MLITIDDATWEKVRVVAAANDKTAFEGLVQAYMEQRLSDEMKKLKAKIRAKVKPVVEKVKNRIKARIKSRSK